MKIYVITLNLKKVFKKLSKMFKLHEFNYEYPNIFIEAKDPDEACHLTYCKFSEIILSQNSSNEILKLIKEIEYDISILKVICKDEKKFR